jgi:beta-lactamase class A
MDLTRPRQTVNAILTLVLLVIGISWSQQHAVVAGARFLADSARKASAVTLDSLRREVAEIRSRFPGDMSIYMKISGPPTRSPSIRTRCTKPAASSRSPPNWCTKWKPSRLSLSDPITTKAGDERLPSGILYALEPRLNPTVKDLLTLMIIISDNEATDLLAEKVGCANVTNYMHSLGLTKTQSSFPTSIGTAPG